MNPFHLLCLCFINMPCQKPSQYMAHKRSKRMLFSPLPMAKIFWNKFFLHTFGLLSLRSSGKKSPHFNSLNMSFQLTSKQTALSLFVRNKIYLILNCKINNISKHILGVRCKWQKHMLHQCLCRSIDHISWNTLVIVFLSTATIPWIRTMVPVKEMPQNHPT